MTSRDVTSRDVTSRHVTLRYVTLRYVMRFGFSGLVDLKCSTGITIYRHDAKIQNSKNHPKIDDEITFKGLLKEIGGMK